MRKIACLFLLLLSLGCNSFQLDEKWLPLKEMVERSKTKEYSGITTTIGTRIYRENINKYLETYPPESPVFDILLYHEQVHSKRQIKAGVSAWVARYSVDTKFMWSEEQLGYYAGFMESKRRGVVVNVKQRAYALSTYTNIVGKMVSYEDALIWVNDALAGRWKPDGKDLWSMPDFLRN